MQIEGAHIIAGEPSREGVHSFSAIDPIRQIELDPSYVDATMGELDRAVESARAAAGALRAASSHTRAELLEAMAVALEGSRRQIVSRAVQETGLSEARLNGEMDRTVGQLRMFAGVLREGSWVDAVIDTDDGVRTPDVRSMLVPLGPVAVFAASNFPLAFSVAGGDTASALAAGCTVILKAHPAHPGTSELVGIEVAKSVAEVGLPAGTFHTVHGGSHDVGLRLVEHPAVRAVAFTGSHAGGRALFNAASRRTDPIPVFAEMGSINPVFVLSGIPRDEREAIASGFAASMTLATGQFCTKPGLVIGLGSEFEEAWVPKLREELSRLDLAPMLYSSLEERFADSLGRACEVLGAQAPYQQTEKGLAPVLLETAGTQFLGEPALAEEIFGPAAIAVTSDSWSTMLEIAEAIPGSLTASIFFSPSDDERLSTLLRILEDKVGRIIFNGFPTGVRVSNGMHHGGPYPATTDPRFTSVGARAIERFVRPLCYQNAPQTWLPAALRDANPLDILRIVDGVATRGPVMKP